MEILYRGRTQSVHDERFINALSEIAKVKTVFNDTAQSDCSFSSDTEIFDFEIITPLSGPHHPIKIARTGKKIGISMAYDLNEEIIDSASRKIFQSTLRDLYGVIVDCQFIKRKLREDYSYEGKIWVIPYGCDFQDFANSAGERSKKLNLIVNRNWSEIHRNEIVLKAINLISKEIDVSAKFAGAGTELSRLRLKYKWLEESGTVRFLPNLNKNQMVEEFNKNWIYVSASISDGSSVSLMEAMSAGLICVTSDFPSNKEWIESGLNGYTFENSRPESLAKVLIEISKISSAEYLSVTSAAVNLASEKADWRANSRSFQNVFTESYVNQK
jgi:glycosyltransferase involved in cell wall biosynthesis